MELSLKRATALGVAQTRLSEGRSKKWKPDLYLLSVQVTPPNPHLGGKDAGRIDITYLNLSCHIQAHKSNVNAFHCHIIM